MLRANSATNNAGTIPTAYIQRQEPPNEPPSTIHNKDATTNPPEKAA
jgi:hypothetical protein